MRCRRSGTYTVSRTAAFLFLFFVRRSSGDPPIAILALIVFFLISFDLAIFFHIRNILVRRSSISCQGPSGQERVRRRVVASLEAVHIRISALR